jgi:hypothetical protein
MVLYFTEIGAHLRIRREIINILTYHFNFAENKIKLAAKLK